MISSSIEAMAILVAVLGSVPYAVWIAVTLIKRRWRKLGYMCAVPVSVYALLFLLTFVISGFEERFENRGVFGVFTAFRDPVFEYDSPRAFNGDGYSISIYTLPASVRKRFETADPEFLGKFPRRPAYRSAWFAEPWRQSPIDKRFERYLSFALSTYGTSELSVPFAAIREALAEPGTFYSFFAYDHGDYPGNVDFFIVDLKRNRLYIINHNT